MSSDFIPPDFISLSVSIWESDIVAFKLSVVPVPYKGNKGRKISYGRFGQSAPEKQSRYFFGVNRLYLISGSVKHTR